MLPVKLPENINLNVKRKSIRSSKRLERILKLMEKNILEKQIH